LKLIKEGGKNPKLTSQSYTNIKNSKQMAYQFTTTSTSPNPYVAHNINNMDLIFEQRKERLDKEISLHNSRIGENSRYSTADSKHSQVN